MKKIIAIVMIALILFCSSSCRPSKGMTNSSSDSALSTTSKNPLDNATTESSTESGVESIVEQQSSLPLPSTSSGESGVESVVEQQSSLPQSSTENTQSQVPVKTKPNFGRGVKCIADLKLQVPSYSLDLPGRIEDYTVDGDLVYIAYSIPSQICVYDTNTGKVVFSYLLPERPAEMHMYGDELWISFPELQCINVYNKADFNILRTFEINNHVFSYDVYNDYIFYAVEDGLECIYKYNLTTQTTERLFLENKHNLDNFCFYEPAILVDKDNSMLYVAETNLTACELYLYNIETLELCGIFNGTPNTSGDNGFGNYIREIFLLDGYIYWCNFKINPTVLWKAETVYGSVVGGDGTLYVDEDYVATRLGVFESNSGKLVLPFYPWGLSIVSKAKFAITKSKNMMYSDGYGLYFYC